MTTATMQIGPQLSAAEVFERVFAQYHGRVRASLVRSTGDWHLAEDLAAETFAQLWRQMAAGRSFEQVENVGAVLVVRARQVLARHRRRLAVQREQLCASGGQPLSPLDAALDPSPAARVEEVVTSRRYVGATLATLPFPQRRAVALHYLEDLPRCEVAAQIGRQEATVNRQIAQGVAALRQAMGISASTPRNEAAARRERARAVFFASVAAGAPLDYTTLGKRFGASKTWAREAVEQAGGYQRQPSARARVCAVLRGELEAGCYQPGERMPSCQQLAERFAISNPNASKVLSELAEAGLLERRTDGRTTTGYFALGPVPAAVAEVVSLDERRAARAQVAAAGVSGRAA